PQFFTEGGNGTPPTYPGPDWFNIFQLELLNVLKEAQINPDKANHTQLVTAMKKLFLDASSNGSDIPDKAAFLSNLGLDTALAGKQAKDDTLTALSGKNVAQLLTYLTLGPIANAADIAAGSANKLIDAYGLNSYFPSRRFGTSGYIRIPNQPGGLILQWGPIPVIPAGGHVNVNYGFAFPEAYLVVIPIAGSSSGAANSVLSGGAGDPKLSFQVFNSLPGVTDGTGAGAYIALGF
ncbi:MAG: hypothetical protein L0K39_11460, partial [Enterobacterales bacterium]|nr:hypothetical protein [Enterobacterales bacterium]